MLHNIDNDLTIQPMEPTVDYGGLILKLTGNLSGDKALILRNVAQQVLLTPKCPKIKLLMTGVDYIDSTGVGVIISIIRQLKARGGSLEINGLNETGKRLFSVLNLNSLDCIILTEPDA